MSRHRTGSWDEMGLVSDELIWLRLQRYTAPIVKPWRVTGHIRVREHVVVGFFDNVYFTEAKARRAFGDVERLMHVRVALAALGIVP